MGILCANLSAWVETACLKWQSLVTERGEGLPYRLMRLLWVGLGRSGIRIAFAQTSLLKTTHLHNPIARV